MERAEGVDTASKMNDYSFSERRFTQKEGTEMLYELMMARQRELEAMEREIVQRQTLERLLQVERLERALKRVRAKLQAFPDLATAN